MKKALFVLVLLCCFSFFLFGAAPFQAGQLVKPDELAALLARPGAGKPLLLHVGMQVLYRNGHIPGSKYVGAGWSPEGIRNLKAEVANLPRSTQIVLYCGCCPWGDCPNVLPAFQALQGLKFTNVKVLYLANNLQQDWTAKGYPTER